MINCTCCNRTFEQQELIGGKCPDCKYKEIEQIICDSWHALEQNREIIIKYMNHVKQLQAEREHYRDNIYDMKEVVCQLFDYLKEHFPQIFPPDSVDELINYAKILCAGKQINSNQNPGRECHTR